MAIATTAAVAATHLYTMLENERDQRVYSHNEVVELADGGPGVRIECDVRGQSIESCSAVNDRCRDNTVAPRLASSGGAYTRRLLHDDERIAIEFACDGREYYPELIRPRPPRIPGVVLARRLAPPVVGLNCKVGRVRGRLEQCSERFNDCSLPGALQAAIAGAEATIHTEEQITGYQPGDDVITARDCSGRPLASAGE